ncbi:CGG triplet repeat-binding protein 1-like [Heterodontus francisci]|uniref:CGG triplet repeat-binding protein 1-like n=1 Tax=Heterodontus francisci TaxID=7792 RepID=UPI00355BFBFC
MSTTITVACRLKEFGSQILHADGGILCCTNCNVLLDRTRQAMFHHHLEAEHHHSSKRAFNTRLLQNEHAKKQATISSICKKLTESSENCQLVTLELVNAFASTNIPLKKLDQQRCRYD